MYVVLPTFEMVKESVSPKLIFRVRKTIAEWFKRPCYNKMKSNTTEKTGKSLISLIIDKNLFRYILVKTKSKQFTTFTNH